LTAVDLARQRDVSFLAGGIAFFAFLSLIPSMVLVLAVGSLVGGEAFAGRVLALVESYLSAEGTQILTEALEDSRGLAGASAVSGVFLLWSSLKVFRAIDVAFDRVYRIDASTPLLEQLRNGTVVSLAIAAGVGALLAVQTLLARIAGVGVLALLGWPATVAGLVVVLLPLYYWLPPVEQSVRAVAPGTGLAVVGLVVLGRLFGSYAALAGQYQAYGAVGAVLLFLLWLYFGALILIGGAVVNAAIREQREGLRGRTVTDEAATKTTD
jgi:membrane protein